MIVELKRQQTELFTLLRKKDLEIMDYKDSGVRLSRSKGFLIKVNSFTLNTSLLLFSWMNFVYIKFIL